MLAVVAAIAVLATHNLVIERLPGSLYVPVCLTTASALLGVAELAGLSAAEVGLSATTLQDGVAAGLGMGLVVVVVVGIAAMTPGSRLLFDDQRMAGVGPAATAYRATVRIPLGTVVVEEVAFRGVLVALVARTASIGSAVVVACALFGLWHIVPVKATLDTNGVTGEPARGLAIAGTVAGTAVVGIGLCWLRLATDSLAAPALVHTAATSTATLACFLSRSGRHA